MPFGPVRVSEVDGWHVALSLSTNVASQGNTPEEACENLAEAMALHEEWPVSTSASAPLESVADTSCDGVPVLTFRQIRFKLENAGYTEVRQKGNHAKFVRRDGQTISTAILPHYLQIASPVLCSVVRQAGLKLHEFLDMF